MTQRTRDDLLSHIATLYASGKEPRISAADARSLFRDFLDSFAFKADLVGDINDLLQGQSWQQGGSAGGGGGLALQTVLDAIRADGSVSGIELIKDTSVDGQITLTIRAVVAAVVTRYAALVDNADADPADFTASVFEAADATSSMSDTFATPAYAGANQFISLGFATPHRLAGIMEQGNSLAGNVRGNFNPALGGGDVTIQIGGMTHYVTCGIINALAAGNTYILVEESP